MLKPMTIPKFTCGQLNSSIEYKSEVRVGERWVGDLKHIF